MQLIIDRVVNPNPGRLQKINVFKVTQTLFKQKLMLGISVHNSNPGSLLQIMKISPGNEILDPKRIHGSPQLGSLRNLLRFSGCRISPFKHPLLFFPRHFDELSSQRAKVIKNRVILFPQIKMSLRVRYNLQIPLQSLRQWQQFNIPFHRLHCKEWVSRRIRRLHRSINSVGILSRQWNSYITAPRPRLILNLSLRPGFPLPPPLNPPSLKNIPLLLSLAMFFHQIVPDFPSLLLALDNFTSHL